MADPDKPVRYIPATAFAGDILAARQAHASVAEMWSAMRDTLAAYNTPDAPFDYHFAPDVFTEVNRLSGNLASVRSAQEVLNAAPATDAITRDVIGRPFYGRDPGAQEGLQLWEGKIEMLMQRGDQTVSQWITVQYDAASLPDTIGDLRDDLEGFATDWATRYEGSLVGTGQVILNAI